MDWRDAGRVPRSQGRASLNRAPGQKTRETMGERQKPLIRLGVSPWAETKGQEKVGGITLKGRLRKNRPSCDEAQRVS